MSAIAVAFILAVLLLQVHSFLGTPTWTLLAVLGSRITIVISSEVRFDCMRSCLSPKAAREAFRGYYELSQGAPITKGLSR